jgi:hypothetical protein
MIYYRVIKLVNNPLNTTEHWTVIKRLFNKKELKDYGQAGVQILLEIA